MRVIVDPEVIEWDTRWSIEGIAQNIGQERGLLEESVDVRFLRGSESGHILVQQILGPTLMCMFDRGPVSKS